VGIKEITGATMTQQIVSCELVLPFSFGSFKLYRGLGRIKAHDIKSIRDQKLKQLI
jgi:hypothetical protein